MNRRWCIVTVAVALQVGPSARAQQPDPRAVQPERPTVATHAGTVATGYLEIETGVERDRLDPSAIGYGVPTVLKIGVSPRAQLSVGVPLGRPPQAGLGLGDMSVGVKWRFVRAAPIVGDFARHLHIPTILMGFGLPDDGLHSPNEKYKIANYYTGIMTVAHFLELYGKE